MKKIITFICAALLVFSSLGCDRSASRWRPLPSRSAGNPKQFRAPSVVGSRIIQIESPASGRYLITLENGVKLEIKGHKGANIIIDGENIENEN